MTERVIELGNIWCRNHRLTVGDGYISDDWETSGSWRETPSVPDEKMKHALRIIRALADKIAELEEQSEYSAKDIVGAAKTVHEMEAEIARLTAECERLREHNYAMQHDISWTQGMRARAEAALAAMTAERDACNERVAELEIKVADMRRDVIGRERAAFVAGCMYGHSHGTKILGLDDFLRLAKDRYPSPSVAQPTVDAQGESDVMHALNTSNETNLQLLKERDDARAELERVKTSVQVLTEHANALREERDAQPKPLKTGAEGGTT